MLRNRKYTKEVIQEAVMNSTSVTGVLRYFGLKISGGNHRLITHRIKEYDIDTTHFTGSLWSKGKTRDEDARIHSPGYSDEEIFTNPSKVTQGTRLVKRLLRLGWAYNCAICGINEWLGAKLTLHLDHIDGNHVNNNFDNLRFLCPNCHQQTDTWGNSKR